MFYYYILFVEWVEVEKKNVDNKIKIDKRPHKILNLQNEKIK